MTAFESHIDLLNRTIGSLGELLTAANRARWQAYAEGKPGDSEYEVKLLNGHIAAIAVSLTLLRQLSDKERRDGKCLLWSEGATP